MALSAAIGLSGLQASQLRLDASAHNIANAVNVDATGLKVVQQERPGGGVDAAIVPASAPPDLPSDVVEHMAASLAYVVSLKVVATVDELGRVLNDAMAEAPSGYR